MPWTLIYSPRAFHQIRDLPEATRKRVLEKLEGLADKPLLHLWKLKDSPLYSFRTGDYRVLCALSTKKLIICVVKIGHRKNVYKDI